MSWTLLASGDDNFDTGSFPLPAEGTAHIVTTINSTRPEVVGELVSGHTELGRITVGSSGLKLEAVKTALNIIPGHVLLNSVHANDPRSAKYELQPRAEERCEVILLRNGDVISTQTLTGDLTCRYAPEVQVNSSAVESASRDRTNVVEGVAETPEDETEDEDLDATVTAVDTMQAKSRQSRATPQLSNQASVVVQETPTAARVNGTAEYSSIRDDEQMIDAPKEGTPSPVPAGVRDAEAYSTARTGQSQALAMKGCDESPLTDSPLVKTPSVSVVVSKKRPSPALDATESETEPTGRSSKRAKRKATSGDDAQDSGLGSIAIDVTTKKGRKRKSEVTEHSETASHSLRSSQRSMSGTAAEPYEGDIPRVAVSNSSINDQSQAVKFLKKQGGALIESVKNDFNILCVRDGNLQKTPKVLQAIARGIPIATDKWLTDSAKASQFLSLKAYQPSVPKQEKEWNFSLDTILGRPQTPFEGYVIHFTSSLQGFYQTFAEIERVCIAAGASRVTKKNMVKKGTSIVLALEEGDSEAEELMQGDVACYHRDLLPMSIFRGGLDLESDEFKLKPGGAGGAQEPKKTRGRKKK